jgi:hypothetical protein
VQRPSFFVDLVGALNTHQEFHRCNRGDRRVICSQYGVDIECTSLEPR